MKKKLAFRSLLPFKIFHITPYEENLITGIHHHTSIEFMCVLSGKGKIKSKENVYSYAEGDVFVFAPGEAHGIMTFSQDTDFLCFCFEPYYIWTSNSGFADTRLLDTFLNRSPKYRNKLSSKISGYVMTNIVRCEGELINLQGEYLSVIKLTLADTLIYMLRNSGYAKVHKMSSSRSYNLESLKKSMDYIDANLQEELDLDVLAEAANMSRSYFCTVFKRYNGIKPWDYITIKRIDKAVSIISLSVDKKN